MMSPMATVNDVREWARSVGIKVQGGANLSKVVIAAFNRAHPDDPHKADSWGHPDGSPADLERQRRNAGSRSRHSAE